MSSLVTHLDSFSAALADFCAHQVEHPIAFDPTEMSRVHGFHR